MSSPRVPARIDRATLDRVLKRAAELQAGHHDAGDAGLSEEEVVALGQEVGISEAQLRQALLEERVRVRPAAEPGVLDRLIAPAEFTADRVVQGSVESVTAALTKWMEEREHLVPQRNAPGMVTFEPMGALAGVMRRVGAAFDPSRGQPYLDKAELVSAVITPLEEGFCHVTLSLTMRKRRSAYLGGGAAVASIGVAAAAIMMALDAVAFLPVIPLVAGGGGGLAVARSYRPSADRAQIGLERVLDTLERTPALPSGHDRDALPRSAILGREVGEAVRDFTREVRKALDK